MAFWTTTPTKDPKRNFRFKVLFQGLQTGPDGSSQPSVWWAKKIAKPNFTVAESKHVYLGHTFYYPGKVEWQAISMTLVDPVMPGSLHRLNSIVAKSGYIVPGDPNVTATMNKRGAVSSIGDITIEQIDGNGGRVEEWKLKNPFIKSVKFSDLDYENDELSTIDLELRYDWAVCTTQDGNQLYTSYQAIASQQS